MKTQKETLMDEVFGSITNTKWLSEEFFEKHWPSPKVIREYEENGHVVKVYEAR